LIGKNVILHKVCLNFSTFRVHLGQLGGEGLAASYRLHVPKSKIYP